MTDFDQTLSSLILQSSGNILIVYSENVHNQKVKMMLKIYNDFTEY